MASKTEILKLLEENRDRFLSGNDIASELEISRSAVWKIIRQLEEEGYPITAIHKKGYRLNGECDILSPQSIRPFVHHPSFFPDIQVYSLLESTNKTAKELANNNVPSGTVIIAEQQSGGRGRLGRSFFSPPEAGIYMSVLLRLQNTVETSMLITSAAAVAVCRAVKTVCDLEAQIKWVNDVYLDGKKLCGILTEASMNFESGVLDYLVIGIGVNVSKKAFPPELEEVAVALEEKAGRTKISRRWLIGEILNELEIVSKDLEEKHFLSEYRERSFILGKAVYIIAPTGTERVTALDINEQGHLIVRRENGEIKMLNTGEISVRRAE